MGAHRFPPGSVLTFAPSAALERVVLGREAAIYGQVLPANTTLHFWQDNRLRHFWLPVETTIQGYRLAARSDGAGDRLHPNGRLEAVWLIEDREVDGVPCTSSANPLRLGFQVWRLGTQRMVWFHDSGRLRQCLVARDAVVRGQRVHRGEVTVFTPAGDVDPGAPKITQW